MSFYQDRILPPLVNLAMRNRRNLYPPCDEIESKGVGGVVRCALVSTRCATGSSIMAGVLVIDGETESRITIHEFPEYDAHATSEAADRDEGLVLLCDVAGEAQPEASANPRADGRKSRIFGLIDQITLLRAGLPFAVADLFASELTQVSPSDSAAARAGHGLGVVPATSAALGLAAVALGAAVLLGWRVESIPVFRLLSDATPMGVDAALAFIACGLGILALALERRRLTVVAGAFAGLIGVIIGVQQYLSADVRIPLIEGLIGADAAHTRTSGFSAAYFAISGAALIATSWQRTSALMCALTAIVAVALLGIPAVVFLAAAANLHAVPGWSIVADKALSTAIGFGLVGGALLLHGWWACRQARGVLPQWIAWLAGATVASATVLFWQTLHQYENLNIEHMLQSEANVLKEAFTDRMVGSILPFMRIKGRWEREGGLEQRSWEGLTAGVMQEHPGFNAIVFLDRDYRVQRIALRAGANATLPLGSAIGELSRTYLDAVRDEASLVYTAPAKLTDRAPEFLMLTGLYVDNRFEGFLAASLGYAPLFGGIVEAREKRGIGVSIRHGDYEVLRTSGEGFSADGRAKVELAWPLMTQSFSASAWLLPSFGTSRSMLPEIVFAAGMLLAAVLVVIVNAAVRARQRLAESEQQYRDTFESAPVAMSWVGPDWRFVRTNRAFRDFLGYSANEFAGMGPVDIAHPSEKETVTRGLQGLLSGETDKVTLDRKYLRKNGELAWAHVTSALIRDQSGRPPFLLSHLQDITARKLTEEQLFQSQKMEALGNLAGGIAHDFNNMLLPIIALTEVSQDELPENHPVQENLSTVVEAAKRASQLVQRILAFSRQSERTTDEIDISRCIGEALQLLRNIVPSTLTIADEIAPGVGIVVGDRAQLHSVIMNLGSNAVHAMDGKVGQLRIGLTRVSVSTSLAARIPALKSGAAYARITVQDSGCGMDRETREKIFNPFFTTKPVGEGTGLGLAMVHGIVESLDGAIDVASEPGIGSTFDTYLPLSDPEACRNVPTVASGGLHAVAT